MIGFRVSNEFKKFLKKMAASENRSLSGFLNNAVLTYLKEHMGVDDWRQEKDSE